jgi:serine/threonine-protein kinase
VSAPPAKTICRKCRLEYPGEALFCPNCGTAQVREDSGDPMVGMTVGERYVLLDRLGHGASGTIYRAEHVTLRRKVAVKVLHHELSRDDLAIERFRREATTVGQIENDHIVEIFDFGRTGDGRLYLAMEFLEGETLADLIEREGQLDTSRAVDILVQLGETLMEAHAMGYIHRDLRPRNVFLAMRRGKGHKEYVKLLDFGLAKLVEKEGEAASTSLGMTFGDPHYMSPEQARGDGLDRRADIYSLGCIAYEMLVGEPPFVGGKVFDILTRHVEATPAAPQARRADVPTWLDRAVVRMLAKRPDQRFITVFRVIEALRQGSDSGHIMADDIAQRPETIPPASVSQAMARLGARAPADMAAEVARVTDADPSPHEADEDGAAARNGEGRGVGGATALGLGVGPAAAPGGKRAQLAQTSGRAAQPASAERSGEAGQSGPAGTRPHPGAGGHPGQNGRAGRGSNGSSGGLSGAWYADGDAMAGEPAPRYARKAPPARAGKLSPSDTGLLVQDDDDIEPRRRPWRVAAIGAGAMALGAVAVFAFVSATDDAGRDQVAAEAEEPVAAASEPQPATTPPAAAATEPAATPQAADASSPGAEGGVAKGEPAPEPTAPIERPPSSQPASGPSRVRSKVARADRDAPAGRKVAAAKRGRRGGIGDEDGGASDDRDARPPARPKSGALDAGKADFYAKMGDRDLTSGDLLGAATNFNKARELDPNNATAVLGLGEVALSQGSTAAAVSHLRRAARLKPGSARAHTSLGEALLASGRQQQAAASFKRALKIDPDDSRAQAGLDEAAGARRLE